MLSEYRTGAITSVDGSVNPGRTNKEGSLAVVQSKAKYADAVFRGNMFIAANQSSASITNLNGTVTGFCLQNPFGNSKYFILYEVGLFQASTAAATANAGVQLAWHNTGATAVTHTTPLTVRNLLLGGGNVTTALVDASASGTATPVAVLNLWQPSVSATATTGIPPQIVYRADGLLFILPGSSLSLSSLSALSGLGQMIWEEVPLPI